MRGQAGGGCPAAEPFGAAGRFPSLLRAHFVLQRLVLCVGHGDGVAIIPAELGQHGGGGAAVHGEDEGGRGGAGRAWRRRAPWQRRARVHRPNGKRLRRPPPPSRPPRPAPAVGGLSPAGSGRCDREELELEMSSGSEHISSLAGLLVRLPEDDLACGPLWPCLKWKGQPPGLRLTGPQRPGSMAALPQHQPLAQPGRAAHLGDCTVPVSEQASGLSPNNKQVGFVSQRWHSSGHKH